MVRLSLSCEKSEETIRGLTLELGRKQRFYILGILRHIADASENLDFSSWAQLIKVFSEEGKKLFLSSCSEPTLQISRASGQ